MPDTVGTTNCLQPGLGATEGRKRRKIIVEKVRRTHIPPYEGKSKTWLSWKSHKCEHGLRSHEVQPDGSISEIEEPVPAPRRKPKTVSSRQWEQGGRR